MVKINWTENALKDLNDIAEYIAKDSARYAEITVSELFYSTEILERFPKAGMKVPEFNDESLRQLTRGNYRIIYKIATPNSIDILTVHNSARLLYNTDPLRK